jgi:hypothetical protein
LFRDNEVNVAEVHLSHELYQAAENLYLRLDLPRVIVECVSSLSVPCQCRLLTNIILTGGNSRLTGLGPRLARDLQSILPRTTAASVRVSDPRLMTGRSDAVIGAAYVRKWQDARWITRRDFVLDGFGENGAGDGAATTSGAPLTSGRQSASSEDVELKDCSERCCVETVACDRCGQVPVAGSDESGGIGVDEAERPKLCESSALISANLTTFANEADAQACPSPGQLPNVDQRSPDPNSGCSSNERCPVDEDCHETADCCVVLMDGCSDSDIFGKFDSLML